ncbi:MAG: two-component system CheB/CheR fusion protein [Nitrospinales bacterium]|jgi:two-component system CheB/CheR fusion protein
MDPQSGIAFVVITHQHHGHTSVLPELLRKCTSMNVCEVTDQTKVKQNCVYLNPPGKNTTLFNGIFHISDSVESRGLSLPIDSFFRSLAQEQKDKAICIILSGTGTDGTLGLREIKGESGMAMVQRESSAKFFGMPGNALSTGLVDYTLAPSKMPARLIKYVKGPFLSTTTPDKNKDVQVDVIMQKIFLQLRNRTGHDFSKYKSNTTRRRIERRMNVHHINNPKEYLKHLQENPQEGDILFKELLISVTAFFRDPDAFKYLKEKVFPKLLEKKPLGSNIRIWVPGCATGEEVYSLAILLSEAGSKLNFKNSIQIFGTDLDPHAIDTARAGVYPKGIAADMSAKYLKNYFDKEDDHYRIRSSIREMAIFAPQNVTQDPPFTKLDFISCRNLLIYLEPVLQKKLMTLFHYSLNSSGTLFLGNSESLGNSARLFNPINKKWKIYSRNNIQSFLQEVGNFDIINSKTDTRAFRDISAKLKPAKDNPSNNIQILMEKHLLSNFAPASVVVDDRGGVFYIHGRTGDYLEPAEGEPDHNILSMAREGLKVELASALSKAYHQNMPVSSKDIEIKNRDETLKIDITVQKISKPEPLQGLFLVIFQSHKPADPTTSKKKTAGSTKQVSSRKMEILKNELQYTRENLQSAIEELETTNEELKSTNEELQSTNEELQSSNEEIETSKEEMQSLNEELQTTNAELQIKITDFTEANDDMVNLLNSTNIATLFLNNDLNVKRFTPETQTIISLISSDIGRPISDIVSKLQYKNFSEDCRHVLKSLEFKECEVQTNDNVWYHMRILPYRTGNNKIDGLVITFINIHELKTTKSQLKESGELQLITDSLSVLVAYVDSKQIYRLNNLAYEEWFGLKKDEVHGKHMKTVMGVPAYNKVKKYIELALKGNKVVFEAAIPFLNGGIRKVLTQYAPNIDKHGKTLGFFSIDTEIKEDVKIDLG